MNYKYGKVTAVRKTPWDSLWHVVYTLPDGRETWDRVEEAEALAVARRMPPHLPRKPLVNRRPARIQREDGPGRGVDWPVPGVSDRDREKVHEGWVSDRDREKIHE